MSEEIINNLAKQVDDITFFKKRTLHLGVFSEPYLGYILEGRKTTESRFSKNKIAPYQQINKDDVVIMKKSSGNIVGYFTIKDVLFLDLSEISIDEVKRKYGKELCVDEMFWLSKKNSNYATLIFIDEVVHFEAFAIHKKGMQSWIKLEKKEK